MLLWVHAALIPVFSLVRGFSLEHTILEAAIVPFTAVLATMPALSRRLRSAAASFGLLSCSAVLVHLSGGVIEMHFHFFVMVAVVALYQDWICFLAAIGYVLIHHGILGAVDPSAVFNHYAALNHPWKWAAIHAFFITGISVACLVTWRLDENLLDRERQAEERLREESRIVETLNDVGRTVAAELDLAAVLQRVTDVATHLTSAALGAFFYNAGAAGGEPYAVYAASGPAGAFPRLPMPGDTGLFTPTLAGEETVRLDDVTLDARDGDNSSDQAVGNDHLPVRSYLAVPVRSARGEVLGRLKLGHPELARFTDVDERLAEGIAAHAAVAIDNARLYEAQRQSREIAEGAQRRLAVLADAGRVLASSLDVDRILGELSQIVAATMADTCAVFLAGDDGLIRQVVAGHDRPPWPLSADQPVAAADTTNPIARSYRSGSSMLLRPAPEDSAAGLGHPDGQPADTSVIVVPLVGRQGPVGVLALSMTAGSGRVLTQDDVTLAEELGRRAAVAVEHARLYANQRSAAETLQHSLLPEVLPEIPGIAIASRYLPAGPDVDVGGDWYDVVALADGWVVLAMGDVVGRGVPAASLMGQLRNGLRACVVDGRTPAQVLSLLNRLLRDVGSPQQMATLVVMLLDPETGELRYANAGHPPPLVKAEDGTTEFLEDAVSVPLGAIAYAEYSEATFALTPGSALILYTDGLVEDRIMPLDIGLDRLRASVVTAPDGVEEMCAHVSAHVYEAGPVPDDIAILAVRWLALGSALDLQLPTQARVLRPLRAALRRWLAAAGATDQETFEIIVATCEACSNAIRHGAPQATHFQLSGNLDGNLSAPNLSAPSLDDPDLSDPGLSDPGLSAPNLNGGVAIVVRSSGRWRQRRPSAPGGRGLDIMRQFMDTEVDTRVDGSGAEITEIRMRRRLVNTVPALGRRVDAS